MYQGKQTSNEEQFLTTHIYNHIYIRHVVLQIEDLNEEIKLSGVDKSSVLASLRDCKSKLEESEMLRDRLTSRMDTLFKKIESEERERETLLQQVDRLNEKVIMQEWIYWGGGCAGQMDTEECVPWLGGVQEGCYFVMLI